MQIQIPERALMVMRVIEQAGGEPFLVGGSVRDGVMGRPSKDVDLEIHGMPLVNVFAALDPIGIVLEVGRSFGVLELVFDDGETFDVSLPRVESKRGLGHRGFDVLVSESLSITSAARRRDFTINSMAARSDGVVIDPFHGLDDLRAGILRATSERFVDDPLRVLRGMQFASRFDMRMDQPTVFMCRQLFSELGTLSADRIWQEWSKWSRGKFPHRGLEVLAATDWIWGFPDLFALWNISQDPTYHPEGDAWTHTVLAVKEAALIARREHLSEAETETLVLAALLHDIGKPATTQTVNGKIISHGHAELGGKMAHTFLSNMRAPNAVAARVSTLVANHMAHATSGPSPSAVRRLARRLGASDRPAERVDIRMLALLCEADASGRNNGRHSPMDAWVEKALAMGTVDRDRPEPILKGSHLIKLGVKPGPRMGEVLRQAFEAQLDGAFADEAGALEWLSSR